MLRCLFLTLLACMALPVQAQALLHAFNWRYATVAERAAEIRALGYTGVLVASPLRSEGTDWWMRYQPQDYRLIAHPLGDTSDFRAMEKALAAEGLALYADLVLNHMANESTTRTDLEYPSAAVRQQYAADAARSERLRLYGDLSQPLFTAGDFNPAFCIRDYQKPDEVTRGRLCGGDGDAGLPDLAATPKVIAEQRRYVAALIAEGVDGFRIDAVKHMPLAHVDAVLTPELIGNRPVVGEIITGGGPENAEFGLYLQPWLDGTRFGAYDFPLFHRIRQAFAYGGDLSSLLRAAADGQQLDPARAWTFAVNHDIPLNGIFRDLLLDTTDEALAWTWLIAANPATPLVYSDNDESGDGGRWQHLYRRADIAAALRFRQAVAGSDVGVLDAGPCHLLLRRGQMGLIGINKCAQPEEFRVTTGGTLPADSVFTAVGEGRDLRARNGRINVILPPRRARLWLLDAAAR
jgi:alpha-amylase